MGVLRSRLLRRLRDADRFGKLAVYCPVPDGDPDGNVNVHAKVMIVDDALVRVGSANLTNRSMGLDTECDLAVESGGDAKTEESIAAFRSRLVGEHLGVNPGKVAQSLAAGGSLMATIEALRGPGRTLVPLPETCPNGRIASSPIPLSSTSKIPSPPRKFSGRSFPMTCGNREKRAF